MDGTATINVQGGMEPYDINWNGFDSNAMAAGVYIITINDSLAINPQSVQSDWKPFIIKLPNDLSTLSSSNILETEYYKM